jgi:hypothetical protein
MTRKRNRPTWAAAFASSARRAYGPGGSDSSPVTVRNGSSGWRATEFVSQPALLRRPASS